MLLSVNRPVDRPTVRFLTVVPPVDRPIDRGLDTESRSSLPVDRPINQDRIPRAELSGGRLARSFGHPAKQAVHVCAHLSPGPVDRQQRQLLIWPLTAIFWEPINWGSLGLFSTRFQVNFQASFSYLSKCLSSLVLEQILSYQRRVFQECFVKEIS